MIARQWIGETRESDAEEYAKYLEETAYVIHGNCGVLFLKRI
jgi:hypothetical protein